MSAEAEQSASGRQGRGGRRLLLGVGIVVLVVVAIAVAATRWLINDRSATIPTEEVIANFRSSTSVATPDTSDPSSSVTSEEPPTTTEPIAGPTSDPPSSRPAPPTTATSFTLPDASSSAPDLGVYRYVTDGFEQVDALGGARHDYPDETTITVTAAGCGVHLRWDVLRERRDEWAICVTSDGVMVQPDGVQFHEFFQQPEKEAVTCTTAVVVVPVDPAAMPTTTQDCVLGEDPWHPTWEVLEHDTRTVEGTEVAVTHVRMTINDDDEHWEHTTIDWLLAPDGLPVEATGTKESSSPSPIGDVVYTEQFHLQLVSLEAAT